MFSKQSQEDLLEQEKKNKSFNIGDKVKLKFIDQYGFISKNNIIASNGCPCVEVLWIMKLDSTQNIDNAFQPNYQTCYKESILVLNKYNNETNKEIAMT